MPYVVWWNNNIMPKSKPHNNIVSVSLFSGCGGLDLGSHMAGVPVVFSNDFDSDSVKTLASNKDFENSTIIEKPIEEIESNQIKKMLNQYDFDKFILIGGPPCQPFSKAGYWVSNEKRLKDKDPRNMIGQYIRVLKDLKPAGFLFENVESILHPTNKHTVENIITAVEKMGYKTRLVKSIALDYGVPQKRKRVFILGSLNNEIPSDPPKTHTDPSLSEKEGLPPHEPVGKYIKKFDFKKYHEPEEEVTGGTYEKELKKIPPGKNYLALTKKRGCKNPKFKANTRFWSFLLKLHPDKPSWTIPAQPGTWVGPFHWTSRRLRVPEIAAIQCFPENYKFVGSRRSIQKQIGNAVPPPLGKAMVEHLIKFI